MAKHSNADLLTRSGHSKSKKGKSNNISVVFDEKSRVEYLTGFQKRNKEKKKNYLEKQKELLHQEKVEKRREKRRILSEAVSSMIKTENELLHLSKSETPSVSSEIKFLDTDNTTTTIYQNDAICATLNELTLVFSFLAHTMAPKFKELYTFEQRKAKYEYQKSKDPSKIPIVCEELHNANKFPELETKRLLVPADITVAQLTYLLRRRMGLSPEEALFIFAGSSVLSSNTLISAIYEKHKDLDGFLYIKYSGENTFGFSCSPRN